MIAYIKTQGCKVVKEGKHLLVKKGTTVFHTLFPSKLSQVLLFGNVELSHSALSLLLREQIDTVFLTQAGRYLGRLSVSESKNIFLRRKQFEMLADERFMLKFARSVVLGKIANMSTVLMRIKRTKRLSESAAYAQKMQELVPAVERAESISSLMGYEGRASALFFAGFPLGLIRNMGFTKRVRRPPTDPVNSILSLLYTFLMNRVYAAVRINSLDPYCGALHASEYGRYSLVLDLMEEFRSIIVETLTLSLFNLNILQEQDFYIKPREEDDDEPQAFNTPDVSKDPIGLIATVQCDSVVTDMPDQRLDDTDNPSQGKLPIVLRPEAMEKVIDAFEKKLTTTFFHTEADRELTYADALIYQAAEYRRLLEGEIETYQPLLLK